MSFIGLLTATEKQAHLGLLHMRPMKNHWKNPESLEKVIPISRSLHPYLRRWLQAANVLQEQPLNPLSHALQNLTDAAREDWGSHPGDPTSTGPCLAPARKQVVKKLPELKAIFLALKQFQYLCSDKIVLSNRQCSCCLHTQGRRNEFETTVCPTKENSDLVLQKAGASRPDTFQTS